ncbi:hypothetical protein BDQ12DRAFT_729889 [Crucibulum laeve]|uniref:Uncharacterized protein n=1 Tax=Crucibulum laeve TaxID=68775 RepID=A0A5C3LGR4_9AGAR|nr:hypothetical protein BDQ12DRAFT_729889 [Crucibulum laeve]
MPSARSSSALFQGHHQVLECDAASNGYIGEFKVINDHHSGKIVTWLTGHLSPVQRPA